MTTEKYYMKCPDKSHVKQIIERAYSLGYSHFEYDINRAIKNFEDYWKNNYNEDTVIHFENNGDIRYSDMKWCLTNKHRIGKELFLEAKIFENDDDFIL